MELVWTRNVPPKVASTPDASVRVATLVLPAAVPKVSPLVDAERFCVAFRFTVPWLMTVVPP